MLMSLLALIALGMGIERRRRDFLAQAAHHGQEVEHNRRYKGYSAIIAMRRVGDGYELFPFDPSADYERRAVEHWNRSADYHEALRIKYEQAARRPWLPVSPDPPRPPNPEIPPDVEVLLGDE
ncbi:MAG TPA: hypothetical protein VG406_10100 [Isosphaeraceae bacterium]|jgi:hypothetical protein|nr:hypothetical protein [Isosphaeraceae bacterium]